MAVQLLHPDRIAGVQVTVILAKTASRADEVFPVNVLWFDDATGALMRRTYYQSLSAYENGAQPDKTWEVVSTRCIEGVVRLLHMVMTAAKGNSSELFLRWAMYRHSEIDWDSLSVGALPTMAERIKALSSTFPSEAFTLVPGDYPRCAPS